MDEHCADLVPAFSVLWHAGGLRIAKATGSKHKARGPNPALHLVSPGPTSCVYLAAAPSSLPLVKEELHFYSPKTTFSPLRATVRLMWPPVKMSLTPWPKPKTCTYLHDIDCKASFLEMCLCCEVFWRVIFANTQARG